MQAGNQELRKPKGRQALRICLSLVLVLLIGLQANVTHSQQSVAPELRDRLRQLMADGNELISVQDLLEPFYFEMLDEWEAAGIRPVENVHITLNPWDFVEYGYDPTFAEDPEWRIERGLGGRDVDALIWQEEETWLTWEFEAPESGLYMMWLDYYTIPGRRSTIQRDVQVNGEYQFNEAKRIVFSRTWRDEGVPEQDNQGNDTRPRQLEVPTWRVAPFQDPDGMYRRPFLFHFEEGVNRITLTAIREPVAIHAIHITSPSYVPTYEERLAEYQANGYQPTQGVMVKVQAEYPHLKADPTVRMEFGWDPSLEPPPRGVWRLNEFGGWRWRRGNVWVDWKVTVPESGLYKLGFKALQNWGERMPVIRSIRVNGEFPAAEWEEVRFDYDRDWRIVEPVDANGNALHVYLEAGENTITMAPMVGPVRRTIALIRENVQEMARLSRMITMVTGPDPDPNFDWEIHRTLPDLLPRMQVLVDTFREEATWFRSYAGEAPRLADQMEMTAHILADMARRPDTIPRRLAEFSNQEASLSHWILRLQEMPLSLDYLVVASPDITFPSVRATPLERFRTGVENFLTSFRTDYTGVGSIYADDEEDAEDVILELWVGRGREWAMIMKEMIEEDFTPATGVRVNVNVIPTNQVDVGSQLSVVLLAAATGNAPDLTVGSNASLPVEFAIRNGVINLNQFPDYPEVAARFRPGALIPYQYEGGDYALPETQGFNMQFSRIDIMAELGLQVPNTWDEVIQLLPTLQQFNMNFYYDSQPANFTPLLYQYGGEYYTEDGYFSALDSPEALEAFRLWTSLYAQYRVPMEANFYNRIRTGEIPIGVADYFNYVLLSTAAPELTGWWQMDPIPGVRQPDGRINRTTGGFADVGVIYSDTPYPEQSWELLKWWTSEEIQGRFGAELEALLGVEARWNTANMEALQNMPWPRRDIAAILQQFEWFKEMPIVLGGYFTPRHVMNAWNRVVLQGLNPREALEIAVKDIDRELRKKQEEFGIEVERRVRQITF